MTLQEINKIHSTKKGIYNRKYIADTGEQFIGLKEGRLKQLDTAIDTTFDNSNTSINSKTIQKAVVELDTDLDNLTTIVNNNHTTLVEEIANNKCLAIAMAIVL